MESRKIYSELWLGFIYAINLKQAFSPNFKLNGRAVIWVRLDKIVSILAAS